MDRVVELLAHDHSGASDVDSNTIWSMDNVMNITGLISGILMLLAPVEEVNVASKIYKGTVLTSKVIQKTEEGTWKASMHEEGYTGLKNTILEIGGLK